MATLFGTKSHKKYDNYMTPKYAWENIQHILPKDKVVWEAFSGNGQSAEFLRELGCDIISKDEDFFENNHGEVIITNPPFTLKKEVFTRFKDLGKPFIVICPCSMLTTQYFRKLYQDEKIQLIIPRKRIQFLKCHEDGSPCENQQNKCNFDCFYYCWKMNLPQDIIWLKLPDEE